MAIEEGLRTLLLAQSSITSLAPSQVIQGTNYPGVFNEDPPQGFNLPYILISQTDFDPMECLDGTRGMEVSVFEVDCYAITQPAAIVLGKAVSDFLKDYSGAAGASDTINAVHWENKKHDKIPLDIGLDSRHQIKRLTFRIQHTAT